ncbi:MAG: hypothetical protein AAF828_07975, partial [Bacteroidota bacterium]
MRFFLLALLLAVGALPLTGQSIGLHPPTVDWQQINTDTVRVIFPAGYEAQAQRVAHQVHLLQRNYRRSIGDQYYKFDLVLQTQNTTPNAYVALAPFRSEFFTTPPQSFQLLGLTPWNDLLTIHEFRHVQQNSNERRGITSLISILQGQLGWAVFSGIAVPNWFAEGDAVIYETALSGSGRGRLASFSRGLRAMELENVRYSYAKTRNGSFKDRVPDHYPYGYLYTTYARRKFGNDVWKDVLAKGAAYSPLFYSFSGALRKRTGLSTRALYQATMEEMAARQDSLLAQRPLAPSQQVSPVHREPAQYFFAHPQADGSIIAYRSTFKRTPEIVRITPGKTEVLGTIGIQREPYLDVKDGLAVWTETRRDPRYTNRDYSDIVLFEIGRKSQRLLTRKGKFLSPSLSHDRKQIVAVEYLPETGAQLTVLNTATGEVEQRFPNPDGYYLAWPVFSQDGNTIYALASKQGQLAIVAQSTETAAPIKAITPFSREVRDMLTIGADDQLYYSSNLDGLDNIYAHNPKSGKTEQLTSVSTGAYYPGVDAAGRLVFSETYAQGHYLATSQKPPTNALSTSVIPHFLTNADAWREEGSSIIPQTFPTDFATADFSNYLGGLKL